MNRELGCHVALILKHWLGTGTTILGIYKLHVPGATTFAAGICLIPSPNSVILHLCL
jgi:hypothetical protein